MELPGLDRLVETCRVRGLSLLLLPPGQHPPRAGTIFEGHPLDPVLAAVYARLGRAVFAADAAGLALFRWDDEVNELAQQNKNFREYPQPHLALPLFEFAGEVALAYSYATVPDLADERGLQPVVLVDGHAAPSTLPVASDVDRFFETYAAYLEALVSHPDYHEPLDAPLLFPWHVPEILARDERLVALLRTGKLEPLLKQTEETRAWVARVLAVASEPRQIL